MIGLQTNHAWMLRPTFKRLAEQTGSLAELVTELAKPEVKAAILSEADGEPTSLFDGMANLVQAMLSQLYVIGDPPDYEPGCKRRCIADDYWETFNRENVRLVTDPIARVEAAGIRDATGKLHEVDVIIEATGFRPFDISDYVGVEGRDGRKLREVWSKRVETFRTMMVPGFPNFFMLLGPNSATGHTSALIMIESQVQYVLRCMRLMERANLRHLDPDPAVVERYNRRLQRDIKGMVFSGGCGAWYTDDNDVNFTLWPYSAFRYLAEQRKPRPAEFVKTQIQRPSEA